MIHNPIAPRAIIVQMLTIGPGTPHDIMDRADLTMKMAVLARGSIYQHLRAMEEEGTITIEDDPEYKSRSIEKRVICRLTPNGLRLAKETRDLVLAVFGANK